MWSPPAGNRTPRTGGLEGCAHLTNPPAIVLALAQVHGHTPPLETLHVPGLSYVPGESLLCCTEGLYTSSCRR